MLGGRGWTGPATVLLVAMAAGCVRSRVETPDDVRPKMVVTGQMMRSALSDPNLELARDVPPMVGDAVWGAEVFVDADRTFILDMIYETEDVKECATVATEAGARILAGFPYADSGMASVTCTETVRAELEITEAQVVVRAGHGTDDEIFGMVERKRAAAIASP